MINHIRVKKYVVRELETRVIDSVEYNTPIISTLDTGSLDY